MFKIITDNGSDIPKDYAAEHGIDTINLATLMDGVTYNLDREISPEEFYARLAKGSKPITSQVNPEQARKYFEDHVNDADDFLFIGISTGLSGTCGSVQTGANEFMAAHPEKRVEVIDSLTGSLGEMLSVIKAVEMRAEGKNFEETVDFVRKNVLHCCLAITVDNLMDLWRGGRVSKTSAVIGNIASVKPFIVVNDNGSLDAGGKIRGRKKSLDHIVDYMEQHMGKYRDMNKTIMIGHGNCPEDAKYLQEKITERFGFTDFMVNNMGPVIGTHTGPTIVFAGYYGESRS